MVRYDAISDSALAGREREERDDRIAPSSAQEDNHGCSQVRSCSSRFGQAVGRRRLLAGLAAGAGAAALGWLRPGTAAAMPYCGNCDEICDNCFAYGNCASAAPARPAPRGLLRVPGAGALRRGASLPPIAGRPQRGAVGRVRDLGGRRRWCARSGTGPAERPTATRVGPAPLWWPRSPPTMATTDRRRQMMIGTIRTIGRTVAWVAAAGLLAVVVLGGTLSAAQARGSTSPPRARRTGSSRPAGRPARPPSGRERGSCPAPRWTPTGTRTGSRATSRPTSAGATFSSPSRRLAATTWRRRATTGRWPTRAAGRTTAAAAGGGAAVPPSGEADPDGEEEPPILL